MAPSAAAEAVEEHPASRRVLLEAHADVVQAPDDPLHEGRRIDEAQRAVGEDRRTQEGDPIGVLGVHGEKADALPGQAQVLAE